MRVLCTICGRGGSIGIKNKVLQKINGKPLIAYTIRQAIKSKIFSQIVVSTDSKQIQKISKKFGASCWFLRPKKLSNSSSPKLHAIKHALLESEKYFKQKFDFCVDLDVTSPMRNISDIKKAFKKFLVSNSLNLFSVTDSKKNPYFNMVEKKNNKLKIVKALNKKIFTSRQSSPKVYELNASIYMFKRKFLLKNYKLINNKTEHFYMPRERSVDIDDKFDLKIVKNFLKQDKSLFKK